MIALKGKKTIRAYLGTARLAKIYQDDKLVYNCYVIPDAEIVHINGNGKGWQYIRSNTEWEMN